MQKLKIKNQNDPFNNFAFYTLNFEFAQKRAGFTLLEILVVLAVLFILASIVTFAISNFRKEALLTEAKTKALAELNLARSQTLGSDGNTVYGIHFEETKLVRFKGSTYSSSDPSNSDLILPPGVKASSISLGGSEEVVFERLTGRALATGTVSFILTSDSSRLRTITIYASGIAE